MSDEEDREFRRLAQRAEFFELVAQGTPELNAWLEVGGNPSSFKRNMNDPEFVEQVNSAKDFFDGQIEQTLGQMARKGHFPAIQFWLLNRQKERWIDAKKIEVSTTVNHNVAIVGTAREVALALLAERGPAEIQSFHQPAIEAAARDDAD